MVLVLVVWLGLCGVGGDDSAATVRGTSAKLVAAAPWSPSSVPSTSLGSVVSVCWLEADIASVGWPVDVVSIVGQELLGEVAWSSAWLGLGSGLRGVVPGGRRWVSSLLDVVGLVLWVSWDCG